MRLRWLLLVFLAACSGEDARPQAAAPDPSPPVAQPAPAPAPAPPAMPSPPAVTISALEAPDKATGPVAMMTSDDSTSHPIMRSVRSHLGEFKRCHARPGTTADVRLVLALSIGPSGRLTALEIKSTDRAFAECIAPAVAAWTFDPPLDAAGKPTSASFQFPFRLTRH